MSYIVPRDKPKRCTRPKCRFMDRDTLDCRLQDKSWESFEEQYEHCPLIEVPTPHGRLIDADFEEQHYTSMTTNPTPDVTEQDKHNSLVIVRALQMAKTIIEAERSEE